MFYEHSNLIESETAVSKWYVYFRFNSFSFVFPRFIVLQSIETIWVNEKRSEKVWKLHSVNLFANIDPIAQNKTRASSAIIG